MTTQSWIRNLFVRRVTPIRKAPRRARLVLEALEDRWVPSTFTVNSIGDTGTGTGVTGDLRYCLTQAILQGRRGTLWMVGKPGANRSRATPRRPCELVKLELADFATRTLREMTLDEV